MSDLPDPSEAAFFKDLFREDELGVVVRAHIHIEAKLIELLKLRVTHYEYLGSMHLDYAQRVNLVVALGLDPEHARALLALGELRNKFAHELDTRLSESFVNNLYDALCGTDKQTVQLAHDRARKQTGSMLPPFRNLTPKDRFILIATALRAILEAAVREIGGERPASNNGMEPTC